MNEETSLKLISARKSIICNHFQAKKYYKNSKIFNNNYFI